MPVHFDTGRERVIPGIVDGVEDKKYRVKWETDDMGDPVRASGHWHFADISRHEDNPSNFSVDFRANSGTSFKKVFRYRLEVGDEFIRDTLREMDNEHLDVWMPHGGGDKKAYHTIEGCSLGGDRLITPWRTIYVRNPGVFHHDFIHADGFKVSVSYCIYMPDTPSIQVYACPDYTDLSWHFKVPNRSMFNRRVKEIVAEHKLMVSLRKQGRDGEADLRYLRNKRDDEKRKERLYKELKSKRSKS